MLGSVSASAALLLPRYANRWAVAYVGLQFALGWAFQLAYQYLHPYIRVLEPTGTSLSPWFFLISIMLSVLILASNLARRMGHIGWHSFAVEARWQDNLASLDGLVVLRLSVLIISVNLGLSAGLQYFFPPPTLSTTLILPPWFSAYKVMQFILLVLAIPILEEYLFRGYIFRAYAYHGGYARAIFFSSGLFMLVHLNFYQIGPALAIGVVLACQASLGTSLLTLCVVHGINNAYMLLVTSSSAPSRWQGILGLSVASLVLIGFFWWSRQQASKQQKSQSPSKRAAPARAKTPPKPESNVPKPHGFSILVLILFLFWALRIGSQIIVALN